MSQTGPITAGIIGCGNISDAYLRRARAFQAIEVVAGADLDPALAEEKALSYGIKAMTPDALLADPSIDLVINLTPPLVHAVVSSAVLDAGKHVYSEKPLAATIEAARDLMAKAETAGKRIGCAPDTFLGGGHQLARQLVDQGRIGKPIGGSARIMGHGMESWHPNPAFFFKPGGGPILDVGPYYVTAMVNLLGPVEAVAAMGTRGFAERIVGSEARRGERIAVEVLTHVEALLRFESGTVISLTASWDMWPIDRYRLELFGTEGTLFMPDPNFFGGVIKVRGEEDDWEEIDSADRPYAEPNRESKQGPSVADYRIIGVVDMAEAIQEGRPQRASAELSFHVLEVLESIVTASDQRCEVEIESRCLRPEPLTAPFASA
jgi:predicted dehydrogenase